jgi:hypothetical protein
LLFASNTSCFSSSNSVEVWELKCRIADSKEEDEILREVGKGYQKEIEKLKEKVDSMDDK